MIKVASNRTVFENWIQSSCPGKLKLNTFHPDKWFKMPSFRDCIQVPSSPHQQQQLPSISCLPCFSIFWHHLPSFPQPGQVQTRKKILSWRICDTQIICLLSLDGVSPGAWHYGHGLEQGWISGAHHEQVWVSCWIFLYTLPMHCSDWACWSPPPRPAVSEPQDQLAEGALDPSYFSHFKGIARGRINRIDIWQ